MIVPAALLAVTAITLVHGWYPKDCCSDQDCEMIDSSRVKIEPSGSYVVDGGQWVIPSSKARVSPDEHYHACINKRMAKADQQMVCFWAPRGSA